MFGKQHEVLQILEVSHPMLVFGLHQPLVLNLVSIIHFQGEVVLVVVERHALGPLTPEVGLDYVKFLFFVQVFINICL